MKMHAVIYTESKEVLAMFAEKEWAEEWKHSHCRTGAVVEDRYYSLDDIRKIEEMAYEAGVQSETNL